MQMCYIHSMLDSLSLLENKEYRENTPGGSCVIHGVKNKVWRHLVAILANLYATLWPVHTGIVSLLHAVSDFIEWKAGLTYLTV